MSTLEREREHVVEREREWERVRERKREKERERVPNKSITGNMLIKLI